MGSRFLRFSVLFMVCTSTASAAVRTPSPESLFDLAFHWREGSYGAGMFLEMLSPRTPVDVLTIPLPGLAAGARPLRIVGVPYGPNTSYLVGARFGDRGSTPAEQAMRIVFMQDPYYIGETEVTQAQWRALVPWLPAEFTSDTTHPKGDDYPMYHVSWDDSQAFVAALNNQGQGTFQLPSETLWEYACRAGTETRFSFGDNLVCGDLCEPCGLASQNMVWCGNSGGQVSPVASLSPNPWGIYDMHGNLEEWCQCWFHSSYAVAFGPPIDGGPWESPAGTYRVLRGGSFEDGAVRCRSASRGEDWPHEGDSFRGFRVARVSALSGPTPTPAPTPITVALPGLPPGARPMQFVKVLAGSFSMGSGTSFIPEEEPVHQVTMNYDYNIGETEVTQAQWMAVMGSLPSGLVGSGSGEGNDFPVYAVSWDDCQTYVAALNALGLGTFRLPSESEWERACRAGTDTELYFGDVAGCAQPCDDCLAGVLPGNVSGYMWHCWSNGANGHPAGSKEVARLSPNQYGLYDTHGNINEWVQDSYHASYAGAPTDGAAWIEPGAASHMLRGGQWQAGGYFCGSARRAWGPSDYGHILWGLRLVWEP